MARTFIVIALLSLALSTVFLREPTSTRAAFPGANGKIAFASDRDGNDEIYIMRADGTGQTNLTNDPASDRFPKWSPDGTRILFISDRDGNDEIYVMNADGGDLRNLTNNAAPENSPAWSPDSSKIAFISERDDPNPGDCWPCNSEVYVMDADGSDPVNVSNDEWTNYGPTWSPDGTTIAFILDRASRVNDQQVTSSGMNIHSVGPGGSDVSQLTFLTGALFCCLDWSPDSTTLATSRASFGTSVDIYLLTVDSGEFERLPDAGYDTGPAWSLDGAEIAFYTAIYDVGEIFAVDADGTNLTNLTNNPAADQASVWSPDGSKIAFESDRDGDTDVFVMNADGSGQINLTEDPGNDRFPSWQPLPIGNVDCASGVSAIDAALVLQKDAGIIDALPCDQNGDVNLDGAVNSLDAALILQYVAGLIASLPP